MERLATWEERDNTEQQHAVLSCWGRFGLAAIWRRLKQFQNQRRRRNNFLRSGGLNYDPLSYAQNFDEGAYDDREEAGMLRQNFSVRFAQVRPPTVTTVVV
ncbi:hypothetical protein LUZ61_010468 [Rhynchospora tenuis]|uniref:Uncharacterized protein n=1 Tax=Rhynchospora tenuis TaxID=198213 RepID=A0AAD5ZZL9_9POAL|nr:hypothetical protein LUZ61_010468 [Rhynchospora tenuis]